MTTFTVFLPRAEAGQVQLSEACQGGRAGQSGRPGVADPVGVQVEKLQMSQPIRSAQGGSAVVALMTASAIEEFTDCTPGKRDRWSRKNAS